jgi:hypothetical protein
MSRHRVNSDPFQSSVYHSLILSLGCSAQRSLACNYEELLHMLLIILKKYLLRLLQKLKVSVTIVSPT